jgi:hypothetical protein
MPRGEKFPFRFEIDVVDVTANKPDRAKLSRQSRRDAGAPAAARTIAQTGDKTKQSGGTVTDQSPQLQFGQLSKSEKVEKLLKTFRLEEQLKLAVEGFPLLMSTTIRAKNPNMTAEQSVAFNSVVRNVLQSSLKILASDRFAVAERTYTDAELDSLLAFYSTPDGTRIANKMYEEMVENSAQARTFGATVLAPELKRQLRENEVTSGLDLE